MDIEAVAHDTPEKIITVAIDPETGVIREDVKKLNEATSQALDTPATAERLTQSGVSVMPKARRSVEYLKKFVNDELADWAKTIKASNISLD